MSRSRQVATSARDYDKKFDFTSPNPSSTLRRSDPSDHRSAPHAPAADRHADRTTHPDPHAHWPSPDAAN